MKISDSIGLVLSGGGYKGVAHIGAIQALEDFGLIPTHISGTSAGAIIGALYAAAIPAEVILNLFKKTSLFNINRLSRRKAGFLDSEKFIRDLKPFFPNNSFEDLQKYMYITTTNLLEGQVEVFDSGELIKPLLASAAFPGVFSPIAMKNSLYADGGILDNFPIKPIKRNCELVIGVDVSPIKKPKIKDLSNSFSVMQRAYYLRAMPNSVTKFRYCDIIVHPVELVNHGLFSNVGLQKIFEIGYKEAAEQIKIYFSKNPSLS